MVTTARKEVMSGIQQVETIEQDIEQQMVCLGVYLNENTAKANKRGKKQLSAYASKEIKMLKKNSQYSS